MESRTEPGNHIAVKWLRALVYIRLVSILITLLDLLPLIPTVLISLVSWAGMITAALCLLRLAPFQDRYRKAALFRIGSVVCMLFSLLFFRSTLVSLASSVFSIIALYQEYYGHSGLLEDVDACLAQKWSKLFLWCIVVSVLTAIISATATLIVAMSGFDAEMITAVVVAVLMAAQLAVDVVYIVYLRKTAEAYSSAAAA